MHIIDLTENFVEQVLRKRDPEIYESAFPDLFAHYYSFWARRQGYSAELTEPYVARQAAIIKEKLPPLADKFAESGLILGDLELVLFVGLGTSNGHAFNHDGRFVVWIPVEAYPSRLAVEVFVPHEIAHALHYTNTPAFYFHTVEEKNRVSRQIITEGLATFVSMTVMDLDTKTALWADYIPQKQVDFWYQTCLRQEELMNRYVLDNFQHPDSGLFTLREEPQADGSLPMRGGYYVGLRLVEKIVQAKQLDLSDALSIPREKFEHMVLRMLRNGPSRPTRRCT